MPTTSTFFHRTILISFSAAATVTPWAACFLMRSRPPPAAKTAARSHTLSTPVTVFTNSEGKSPLCLPERFGGIEGQGLLFPGPGQKARLVSLQINAGRPRHGTPGNPVGSQSGLHSGGKLLHPRSPPAAQPQVYPPGESKGDCRDTGRGSQSPHSPPEPGPRSAPGNLLQGEHRVRPTGLPARMAAEISLARLIEVMASPFFTANTSTANFPFTSVAVVTTRGGPQAGRHLAGQLVSSAHVA